MAADDPHRHGTVLSGCLTDRVTPPRGVESAASRHKARVHLQTGSGRQELRAVTEEGATALLREREGTVFSLPNGGENKNGWASTWNFAPIYGTAKG